MKRRIVGFHQDEEAHWVADLDCGHGRHVRHDPPFIERPWVLAATTREARRGETLDCVRCDALEWPAGLVPIRRTRSFEADTIPAALRRSHTTKPGVWAKIHVEQGRLRYRLLDPPREWELEAGEVGLVPPEAPHEVEAVGSVRFFVELHRRGPDGNDAL